MSTLISSAAAGKKAAAPKAPPGRRRPAALPAAPKPAQKPADNDTTEATNNHSTAPPAEVLPTPPANQPPPAIRSAAASSTTEPAQARNVRFAEPNATHLPLAQDGQAQNVLASPRRSKGKEKVVAPAAKEPQTVPASTTQAQTPPPTQRTQRSEEPVPAAPPVVEPPVVPSSDSAPRVVVAASDDAPRGEKRARDQETATEAQPRKAPKRSAARSNAAVQAQAEEEGHAGPSQSTQAKPKKAPARKPRKSAKNAQPAAQPGENVEAQQQPEVTAEPPAKSKKPATKRGGRKAKTPARVIEDDDEAATAENAADATAAPATTSTPKAKKPRQPRQKKATQAPAPSGDQPAAEVTGTQAVEEGGDEQAEEADPELHEIDPNSLSMYSLSRQKRYGKTSDREKKMAEIDWDEVKRKRHEEAERVARGDVNKEADRRPKRQPSAPEDGEEENLDGEEATEPQVHETRAVQGGIGLRVVNGMIDVDEDTTQHNRMAEARDLIDADPKVEEENDLTRHYNRTTYMLDRKRNAAERLPFWKAKSDPWSEEETDKFYDALRNWGTDFMIISGLFPGKTRMQIKKKFTREEKLDPERITASLMGQFTNSSTNTADRLETFALTSNVSMEDLNKYRSLEHANEVIAESMRDKEEAMRAAVAEEEENERQRQIQQAQQKSAQEKKELRKRQTQAKRAAKRKGVYGEGTFGGAPDSGLGDVVPAGDGGGD